MMWRTRTIYQDIIHERMDVESRFTKNLPIWPAFDKFANGAVSRTLWVLLYILFFVLFAHNYWLYLLLPIIVSMGAVHGAIINWFAHKYGYINFNLKNTSMNLLFVDVLMLGESYHNNHHKHPSSINFGDRWYEIDPMYPVIRLFAWMRIITLAKPLAVPTGETDF